MLANGGWDLTLILLTWTIWRAPDNASKWRMGFNSAFKGLMLPKMEHTCIYTYIYIYIALLNNDANLLTFVCNFPLQTFHEDPEKKMQQIQNGMPVQ